MENRQYLLDMGALAEDLDSLSDYLDNKFAQNYQETGENDAFLEKWERLIEKAEELGVAEVINQFIAGSRRVEFQDPQGVTIEIYPSLAGPIPIILLKNTADFEALVTALAYKGEYRSDIHRIGASFLFGRTTRFIILSNKPYSNVLAAEMDLADDAWLRKSYEIRREHECAHYFTKRYYGLSRNNLHDEMIADFMGFTAAFGKFQAAWFTKALGLHGNSNEEGRFQVYIQGLSETGAAFLKLFTIRLAQALEKWSNSEEMSHLTRSETIRSLCEKSLIEIVRS